IVGGAWHSVDDDTRHRHLLVVGDQRAVIETCAESAAPVYGKAALKNYNLEAAIDHVCHVELLSRSLDNRVGEFLLYSAQWVTDRKLRFDWYILSREVALLLDSAAVTPWCSGIRTQDSGRAPTSSGMRERLTEPQISIVSATPIVSETTLPLVPVGVCDVVGLGDDAALLAGLAWRCHRD
ncbi:unnamed protein product, partial [Ectocarpus sp. 13 AM-2016]